jgi:hypothetical protein
VTIPRRVTQAGLRITGSILELVFGTGADQPAAGNLLPGASPVDSTGAATGQVLAYDGASFVPANAPGAVGRVQTTDATVTTAASFTPADGTVVSVWVAVDARQTDGTKGASYLRRALYRRVGGTVTLIGSVQTIGTDAEETAGWDATLDISSTLVRVRVTGAAATTIDWTARITLGPVAP